MHVRVKCKIIFFTNGTSANVLIRYESMQLDYSLIFYLGISIVCLGEK